MVHTCLLHALCYQLPRGMHLERVHVFAATNRPLPLREAVVVPAAAVRAVLAGRLPSRCADVEAAVAPAVRPQRQVVTGLVQQRSVRPRAPRRRPCHRGGLFSSFETSTGNGLPCVGRFGLCCNESVP